MVISDDFWDRFMVVAKACYIRDKNADVFDVFDTYRTRVLGGWDYTATFLEKLDAQIDDEERRKRT